MNALASVSVRTGLFQGLVLPPGVFRLLLAGGVVLSHVTRADVGRLAVLLFFFLSGYWTARIWQEKFEGSDTWRFYAARYLRIAPLYFLTMLAGVFFRSLPMGLENWTIFGNATTHRDPTGVAWSLDIELQFYVLLPFIAAGLAATRSWIAIALAVVIGAAGCWLGQTYGLITIAKYLPAFILGSLTFTKAWRPSERSAVISLAAFVAMTILTGFTPFLDKKIVDPFDIDIWSFFWMLPLLPFVARSLTVRSTKLDRHLGNLSYPLYLVHFGAIAMLREAMGGESLLQKGLGVAISVILTLIVYIVVDRPVDRWRVRLTEQEKPKPQPAAKPLEVSPQAPE